MENSELVSQFILMAEQFTLLCEHGVFDRCSLIFDFYMFCEESSLNLKVTVL